MCTSDIRRLSIILARRPSLIDTAIRQQWYFCASHSDRSLKYYPRALWIPGDQLNVMLNALTRRIEMHMGISFYEKKKAGIEGCIIHNGKSFLLSTKTCKDRLQNFTHIS